MAKETFYFSHDYHARSDKKMVRLLAKTGLQGVGIYWCLIEMLYEEGGYLKLNECDCIASELRTKCERIEAVIKDFDLFKNDGIKFWSSSVIDRLKLRKDKSEKAKDSAKKRWSKLTDNKEVNSEGNANALRAHSEGNAIKESKVNKSNILIDFEDAFAFMLQTKASRHLSERYRISDLKPKFKEFFDTKSHLIGFTEKSKEEIVTYFTNWLPDNLVSEHNRSARKIPIINPSAQAAN